MPVETEPTIREEIVEGEEAGEWPNAQMIKHLWRELLGGDGFTPCNEVCPGGRDCCCDQYTAHRLHICTDPDCYCHTEKRYEVGAVARVTVGAWIEGGAVIA